MASLPGYDESLVAFHAAFRPELYTILDRLPLPPGGRILDVPCGDGFYSRRLAGRLGDGGKLVAVDACDGYLARARAAVAGPEAVEVMRADAYRLPFTDASFDLVWCAQSLISLDVVPAVREMRRVTAANGVTAILESDEFHRVLLPWPVELEAALPAAVLAGCVQRYGDGAKLSPARRLRPVLRSCGFSTVRRRTHTAERVGPFTADMRAFLLSHCAFLREFIRPHLPAALRPTFDRLTDEDGAESFFRLPDVELTCLLVVHLAGTNAA